MSIYDISYTNRVVELLPPDKRYSRTVAWFKAIVNQLQYLHTDVLVDFRTGSDYPIYAPGSYNKFDRVIYGQSVYESLYDTNTAVPTDTSKWRLYQLHFLGVEDRLKYNGQVLVLDYAINDRFNTNFRQPPLQSDIYFTINTPAVDVFIVGGDESNSSTILEMISSEYVINSYSFTAFTNFVINIPVAVYNALSTDPAARDKIVRGFVDEILHAGLKYSIQTY
jgi:hypothetical protein